MTQSILIVGASGLIGQHLFSQLNQREDVQAFASTRAQTNDDTKRHLDLADQATYNSALEGIDRVFVLSPGGNTDAYALVAPFINKLINTPHIEHVVLMTAQGIEQDDTIALRRLEILLEDSAKSHTILRPNWFMQNFQTYWYEGIKAHGVIALPAGDAKTAFVDTRDIAESAVHALIEAKQGAFTLTGSEAITYSEAASILSKTSNQTIAYQAISPDDFQKMLLGVGLDASYVHMMLWLFESVRDGHAAPIKDGVQALTGRAPRRLEDYAQDHAELF